MAPSDSEQEFDIASVKPLDTDGVAAIAIGTVLFAIAFVVSLFWRESLAADGREWWIWVCAVGAGLGVIGTAYTARRRAAYRAAKADAQ